MRKTTLVLALLLGLGVLAESLPGLEAYLGVPRYDRPRWDPGGTRLAFSSEQILYVREPDGSRRALSRSLRPVSSFFWTADGQALIAEVGRENRSRIYRVPSQGGPAQGLTPPGPSCRHAVLGGDRLLAYSRDETSVWVTGLDDRRARKLYAGPGRLAPVRFSPDGKQLLVLAQRSNVASDLLTVEVASGRARRLISGSRVLEPRWRGNRRIQALTDQGRDFLALCQLDLDGQTWTPLVAARGDVESYAWGADHRLAYVVNDRGVSELYLRAGQGPDQGVAMPPGVIRNLAFRKDGSLAFWFSGPRQPGSAWLLPPGSSRAELVLGPSVRQLRLLSPRHVTVPGARGMLLPALLYPGPPGSPAVVVLHGGPANQSRPEFSPLLQYLATHGYTVLLPDYRGSLGYGRGFLAADDGALRTLAVDDVLDSSRWLAGQGHSRVVLAGFSYGGFLALAALAREPALFRGAISLSGITDLSSFVESSPGRRETRSQEYGDPDLDAAVLADLSPSSQVPRLRLPVLVMHGDQDDRVPVAEAEKFVRDLKASGAPVEFVPLVGEGHGLSSSRARQAGYQAMVDFIDRVTAP